MPPFLGAFLRAACTLHPGWFTLYERCKQTGVKSSLRFWPRPPPGKS